MYIQDYDETLVPVAIPSADGNGILADFSYSLTSRTIRYVCVPMTSTESSTLMA